MPVININNQRRQELRNWLINPNLNPTPSWIEINSTAFIYVLFLSSNDNQRNAIALNNNNTICISAGGKGVKLGKRENSSLSEVIRTEVSQGASINNQSVFVDYIDKILVKPYDNLNDLIDEYNFLKPFINDTITNEDGYILEPRHSNCLWFAYSFNTDRHSDDILSEILSIRFS